MDERVPTNLRALLILETIGNSEQLLSPSELARVMELPKQTVHRICTRLIEEGFLTTEADLNGQKGLRPGRRMRQLANGFLRVSPLHCLRHQILMKVAGKIKETVNYVMPGEKGMHYVDRVETDWAFRVQLPVGTHVPFHCTASGKTFLASLSPKVRKQMVETLSLEQLTNNSITEPDELLAELKQVARQGYAIDNQEFIDGMVAIAVPIFDDQRRYVAALAFHGPVMRLSVDKAIAKRQVLLDAAGELERL